VALQHVGWTDGRKISEKRKLLNLYASQLKKFQITAMIRHAQANDRHYYENYWKFE